MLGISLLSCAPLHAASFVYEGQLDDRGAPANGRYDIQLAVYRDVELGATLSTPIVFNAVDVVDGRFRLDFEVPLDAAEAAWVELAVRDAGGSGFSAIPGRTKATQAPAAIDACWSSVGDSGSNPATNFLGTTDAQPLVLRTANAPSLRIEPSSVLSGGLPITTNTIGGSDANMVTAGVRGATIAGGGVPVGNSDPAYTGEAPNQVTQNYGTVGGGYANRSEGIFATAGGGFGNVASGELSTIGGGTSNSASGANSAVAGGISNSASGEESSVGGGFINTASGDNASVTGGSDNTASGAYAAVGGGIQNCAGGQFSMAVGSRAKVRPGSSSGEPGNGLGCFGVPLSGDGAGDSGTFVWADNQGTAFTSTGDNQFLVRASGGVGINAAPTAAASELSVFGTADVGGYANFFMRQNGSDRGGILLSAGDASTNTNNAALYVDQLKPDGVNSGQVRRLELDTGGRLRVHVDNPIKPTAGTWSAPSDARLKQKVLPLQGSLNRLLALHGVSYEYKIDAPSGYFVAGTHAGFVAQEVQQVFPNWVSSDASGYLMLGPQGFEAFAVEALRELRNEGTLIDAAQADELRALKVRNKALEDEAAKLRASDQAIRQELTELRALIETQRTGDG